MNCAIINRAVGQCGGNQLRQMGAETGPSLQAQEDHVEAAEAAVPTGLQIHFLNRSFAALVPNWENAD